jgi:Arc/MetJ-type ribon-helix-helix transcriptional regulator
MICSMTTLSVPIPATLEIQLDNLVAWGVGPNRAAVTRVALQKLSEDTVVQRILDSMHEPDLQGDPRRLLAQF